MGVHTDEELDSIWNRMREMIKDSYILKGEFTLSSGQISDLYVDIKSACTEYQFMTNIITLLYNKIEQFGTIDKNICIVGLESGAIPLLTALQMKYRFNMAWIRKIKRDHGIQEPIVGFIDSDDRFIIVEDVIMSGRGINRVANVVGIDKVVGVVCVVNRSHLGDRLELMDGKSFQTRPIDVRALFDMKQLISNGN
jgi:orotate phosphoribosyltransferase